MAELFGANEPAPLQVALVAPPPKLPASVTVGLLEHTVWFGPAFTCAAGLMVTTTCTATWGQGAGASVVVSVRVTVPAVMSAADGV